MHPRRDQDLIQNALESDRQPHVAVLEKRVSLKYEFVAYECSKGHTDHRDLKNTKYRRKEHLAEVKPETGRNIEVRIKVMDIMEAPQHRDLMVGDVPIVEAQIEQEKTNNKTSRPPDPIVARGAPGRPRQVYAPRSVGDVPAVGDQPVDGQDVEREDGQRPEG